MACNDIVSADGAVVGHVCRPDGETIAVPHRRKKRWWCFNCRKHLMHTLMRFYHVQPSWYEDWTHWECPRCHEEHVLFPGREWVREDG